MTTRQYRRVAPHQGPSQESSDMYSLMTSTEPSLTTSVSFSSERSVAAVEPPRIPVTGEHAFDVVYSRCVRFDGMSSGSYASSYQHPTEEGERSLEEIELLQLTYTQPRTYASFPINVPARTWRESLIMHWVRVVFAVAFLVTGAAGAGGGWVWGGDSGTCDQPLRFWAQLGAFASAVGVVWMAGLAVVLCFMERQRCVVNAQRWDMVTVATGCLVCLALAVAGLALLVISTQATVCQSLVLYYSIALALAWIAIAAGLVAWVVFDAWDSAITWVKRRARS